MLVSTSFLDLATRVITGNATPQEEDELAAILASQTQLRTEFNNLQSIWYQRVRAAPPFNRAAARARLIKQINTKP